MWYRDERGGYYGAGGVCRAVDIRVSNHCSITYSADKCYI